ncbi:MAG: hypothetical protein ACRD0G_15540 [Acidimicrobiales bacterium]
MTPEGNPAEPPPALQAAAQQLIECPPHELPGEPPAVLGQLARLGEMVEREPRLLALRARCRGAVGQTAAAWEDVRRAIALTGDDDVALRRWLTVLDAHFRFRLDGGGIHAKQCVLAILEGATGEYPTTAYGFRVLGEIAAADASRESMEQASRLFQLSRRLWERCGSAGNLRATRAALATDVLVPLGRFHDATVEYDAIIADPESTNDEVGWFHLLRGFARIDAGSWNGAEADFAAGERMARDPLNPIRISVAAWGRAVAAARSGDKVAAIQHARRAENVTAMLGDRLTVPCLCELSMEFGALGELDAASEYLDRARQHGDAYATLIDFAAFLLDARRGVIPTDLDAVLERTEPGLWARALIVTALAAARNGDTASAAERRAQAERELERLGVASFRILGEQRTCLELAAILDGLDLDESRSSIRPAGGLMLQVLGSTMTALDELGSEVLVAGRNQRRLLALIAANGGSISVDAAAEALWPDEPTGVGRRRMHNVHTRLRTSVGTSFRDGETFSLSGMTCDLIEFDRLADEAMSNLRRDPDRAAEFAFDAVALGGGDVLGEFDEPWADLARHRVAQQRSVLIDFLAVRAHDSGNVQLAERWSLPALAAAG